MQLVWPWGDTSAAAEDVANGVAGAEAGARDDAGHRHPSPHQAFQPCVEIAGVGFHSRQALAEQAQCLQTGAVVIGVGVDGEISLHRVIHGTDAGREEQPFRCPHRHRRVEDDRDRDDSRMHKTLFEPQRAVGDPGPGVEFAG